jgi:tetratricopeptide (TPR) repeat protein
MSTAAGFSRRVLWVGVLLALTAGCAGLGVPHPLPADMAEKRQDRAEEAVREFESKRDLAELQAALAHWNRGDVKACEESLRRLLDRNPDHREARLLMAEVCLADHRPQAAYEQVQQALAAHPHDAQVQYTTGLVLDATGQGDPALAYYERAAELEPDNEVYALGYQTALEGAGTVGAWSVDSTGLPGQSSEVSAGPALVIPDPTAQNMEPAATLAGGRPEGPKPAAPASETARPSTTLRLTVPGEGIGRADLADSAEAAEMDRVGALIAKGRAALAEGSGDGSVAYFRQAAAVRPDDPQIPITAAMAALRGERPDVAVELLRPDHPEDGARRRLGGSAQLYRVLGVAYYRLGDYRSSEVALRQALSLDKSSALSYLLMGCTLSKLGQFESAEAYLRQARTINPRYTVQR